MTQDLVSIITPTYNSARFIAETIESVLAQTYQNWEMIIADDCSTDDTVDIVSRYAAKDGRIRLCRLDTNSGAGVARNRSIAEARGRYIAFLDSDDLWLPRKLERQLAFMRENGYEFTYTEFTNCDESGKVLRYAWVDDQHTFLKLHFYDGIACLTAMYDTARIGKFYMPTIRRRQDWCLWLDIIRRTGKAYGLHECLASNRLWSGSISSSKFRLLSYHYHVYHDFLGYSSWLSVLILYGGYLPTYFYKKAKRRIKNRIYKFLNIKP